uniref:Putative sulfate permease family protein n=1 Tax=Vaucheria litorea TaxID=109269 RepID=H6WBB2_VAULI|nr:putative sulfate permease family protein [Vaucheria litorea]
MEQSTNSGNVLIDPNTGELNWNVPEPYTEKKITYAQSCGCSPGFKENNPFKWLRSNKTDILAGITVGLTAVPTAVAFSVLANVNPSVGLRGSWIIMLTMAIFGGRPGMIYCNSGSMGVILEPLNKDYSVEYMFYAFIIAGIVQIIIGYGGIAKVVRLMPVSVMIGFVNGLAIVLLLAQVKNFKRGSIFSDSSNVATANSRRLASTSFDVLFNDNEWISGSELGYMFIVVISTMLTVIYANRVTNLLPPILIGVIVATIVEWGLIRGIIGSETNTLGEVAEISGTFPQDLVWTGAQYKMPPLNADTLSIVIGPALSLLAVGLVESLMTVRLVNEITCTPSNINREAIFGGVGNLFAGTLGGQGGNSEIGLTMVNLRSGGRNRVAGVTSGLLVLIIVLGAYPVINLIPMAGLVGVMVVIAWNTFDWSSLPKVIASLSPRSWRNSPDTDAHDRTKSGLFTRDANARRNLLASQGISRPDALIIIAVTIITPFTNLAIAVGVGVGLALLTYTWQSGYRVSTHTYFRKGVDITDPPIIKVYDIVGPIFYASTDTFLNLFDYHNDPPLVEIHFYTANICDYSALQAINTLGERYKKSGRKLRLRFIRGESLRVITRGNQLLGEEIVVDLDEKFEETAPTQWLHRVGKLDGISMPAHNGTTSLETNFQGRGRRRTIDVIETNNRLNNLKEFEDTDGDSLSGPSMNSHKQAHEV